MVPPYGALHKESCMHKNCQSEGIICATAMTRASVHLPQAHIRAGGCRVRDRAAEVFAEAAAIDPSSGTRSTGRSSSSQAQRELDILLQERQPAHLIGEHLPPSLQPPEVDPPRSACHHRLIRMPFVGLSDGPREEQIEGRTAFLRDSCWCMTLVCHCSRTALRAFMRIRSNSCTRSSYFDP